MRHFLLLNPIIRSLFVAFIFISFSAFAQKKEEVIHTISKSATKGYLYEASQNESGNIELVYNVKAGKDKVKYEIYEFDKSLKFIGQREVEEHKSRYVQKKDINYDYIGASVGGGSSFTILSTKLNLYSGKVVKTWNMEKQRYDEKESNRTEFKPKNASNKSYYGRVAFWHVNGSIYLLVTSSQSEKDEKSKEYSLMKVGTNLEQTEYPITFDRPHVLTYSLAVPLGKVSEDLDEDEIENHDMVFVFAPLSGDLSEYTVVQMDTNGKERYRFTMKTPRNIMAINAHYVAKDGTIYFSGLAVDSKKTFDNAIGEYAPIENPSYTQYGVPNYKMEMYLRGLDKTQFEDFVAIKIKDGKVDWMNSTPVKDFKSKLKTPPNQKKGYAYDGRFFAVQSFYVLPDESMMLVGQIKKYVFKPEPNNINYLELICFHINSQGEVLGQYSYTPLSDSKSILFPIPQILYPSSSGNALYWINLEVKSTKGYSSFMSYYYNTQTIYANYYPSVGKIDLRNNTVSNFDVMGDRKFLLNRSNLLVALSDEKALVFIGEDRKGKIMLAKYVLD